MQGPPVVVHVGYHKTGSTWLQRHLFDNPAVGLSSIKPAKASALFVRPDGLEFDAGAVGHKLHPELEAIRAGGRTPVITCERLTGSPFSGGHDSREVADRVHAVLPGARILLVIREQREMIRSTYAQYVRMGGAWTFEKFVGAPTDTRVPLFRLDYFRYDRLVGYYQQRFGAANVMVLPYEQLRTDPAAFVGLIAGWAGRPTSGLDGLPFSRRENPTMGAVTARVLRSLNLIVSTHNSISPRLGDVAPRATSAVRVAAALAAVAPRSLDERLDRRARLQVEAVSRGRYGPSNRRTAALTGLDLEALGYQM